MQPFNYSMPVADPLEASLSSFRTGIGIRNAGIASRKAESDFAYEEQKRGQEAIDAQAAREASLRLQQDLATLSSNPEAKAEDFASMMVRYPQLSEHFKRGWDVLDQSQKADKLLNASQVYAAISAGKNDIATGLLTERAAALRNAGKEDEAKGAETMAELIKIAPEAAKTSVGLLLAAVDPDKFGETFTKLETERRANDKHEPELEELRGKASEAKSKAEKAAVDAKFAESNAVMDLSKKGWDINKIQEDITVAKENSRIAAMNAAIGREANQLKREELTIKRDEAVRARDEALIAKTAEAESARFNIDNFLNTADRILATPMNVVGSAAGPVSARMPTLTQETADFEALIENFDAQAFLSQIPLLKGMGALSNAEGLKVSAALQSLNLKQSPERLMENVREAQRLMMKARKNLAAKFGVPDTVPDTPAAAEADDVDALIEQYSR